MPGVVLAGQRVLASSFSFTIANLATGQVNNTITETIIGSLAVPAGATTNQGYTFKIEGTNDNVASASTVLFRVHYGTTGTISDLVLITYASIATPASAQTGVEWDLNGWFRVITPGATGSTYINCSLTSLIANVAGTTAVQPGLSGHLPSPINWNAANLLTVSAQWGNANVGNVTRTLSGSLAALN